MPSSWSHLLLALLGVVLAATRAQSFDVTQQTVENIHFTEDEALAPGDPRLAQDEEEDAEERGPGYRFIGDLMLGQRLADEMVYRRRIDISNPTDEVYNSAVMVSVERGTIHYMNVANEQGSYAVVCEEPYSLGTSRTSFNVRVPPKSQTYLALLVAAH